MALKIAVAGKGGVGKSTVAALLASLYAREGKQVIAVDADPAWSLPSALGIPEEVRGRMVPLSSMLDLVEERTGVRPGEGSGGLFVLNPRVADLVDQFAVEGRDGVEVIVLGTVSSPGGGCYCPESALLRALLRHLVLEDDHVVIIDLEAGVEHLGRSTVQGVEALLVVVEPGRRSVETAGRIAAMARELGVGGVFAVLNKVSTARQEGELRELLGREKLEVLASLPLDERLVESDLAGRPAMDSGAEGLVEAVRRLKAAIDERVSSGSAFDAHINSVEGNYTGR